MVELTDKPIDTQRMLANGCSPNCGAILLFLGTTRRFTGEQETDYLVYEAYAQMAISQLQTLRSQAIERWSLYDVQIVHRLGRVDPGEASVAIVVSSPHRREAFAAGEWLIDELKRQVPIWKQDHSPTQTAQWQHPTVSLTSEALPPNNQNDANKNT